MSSSSVQQPRGGESLFRGGGNGRGGGKGRGGGNGRGARQSNTLVLCAVT